MWDRWVSRGNWKFWEEKMMMPFKATQKGNKFKFLIQRGLLLLTVLNICRRIRKLFPLHPLPGIPSSATTIPCWSEQSINNINSLSKLICSSPPCPLSSICPFPLQFVLHTSYIQRFFTRVITFPSPPSVFSALLTSGCWLLKLDLCNVMFRWFADF